MNWTAQMECSECHYIEDRELEASSRNEAKELIITCPNCDGETLQVVAESLTRLK